MALFTIKNFSSTCTNCCSPVIYLKPHIISQRTLINTIPTKPSLYLGTCARFVQNDIEAITLQLYQESIEAFN